MFGNAAHFADDAGNLQSHPRRTAGRRGIVPFPLHEIGAVHTGVMDFNKDVFLSADRVRYIGPAKGAVVLNQNGFHRDSSWN